MLSLTRRLNTCACIGVLPRTLSSASFCQKQRQGSLPPFSAVLRTILSRLYSGYFSCVFTTPDAYIHPVFTFAPKLFFLISLKMLSDTDQFLTKRLESYCATFFFGLTSLCEEELFGLQIANKAYGFLDDKTCKLLRKTES